MRVSTLRVARFALSLVGLLAPVGLAQEALRQEFDAEQGWKVSGTEDSTVTPVLDAPGDGSQGHSLRLDYVISPGGGQFTLSVPLAAMPAGEFELTFDVKGDGSPLDLECLVGGPKNRLAACRPDLSPKGAWTTVKLASRRFLPRGSGVAGRIGRDSFALTGATSSIDLSFAPPPGGKGSMWIDHLTLTPLRTPASSKPVGTASSRMCELHDPSNLFDGDPKTAWECEPNENHPWYSIDLGDVRSVGGLAIAWETGYSPASVKVLCSDDGVAWKEAWQASSPLDPERLFIPLPDARTRHLKLQFERRDKASAVGIQTLEVREPAFGDDPSELLRAVAAVSPRGAFPRAFVGEPSQWTLVGVPGDAAELLVSEDGQIELDARRFMIEPFLTLRQHEGERVVTWNESTMSRTQTESVLPIPVVTRKSDPITMRITSLADGRVADSAALICYELTNTSAGPVGGNLVLAVRPLQVLGASLAGHASGLAGDIRTLTVEGSDLLVNADHRITFHTSPNAVELRSFASAPTPPFAAAALPTTSLEDSSGLATALARFEFSLNPGQSRRWWVTMPLHGKDQLARLRLNGADPDETFRQSSRTLAKGWVSLLANTKFRVPEEAQSLVQSWYSSTAQMLLNLDGPALQAGSRVQTGSSIRDASAMCEALLAAGRAETVKIYLNWYAAARFAYGKMPAALTTRGRDPLDAGDACGRYISLVSRFFRFTHDQQFLQFHFPLVRKAVEHIEFMRALSHSPEAKARDEALAARVGVPPTTFIGLVPPSTRDGDEALHAYAADWESLRGLHEAVELATAMGDAAAVKLFSDASDRYAADLKASVASCMKARGIAFVPSSAERGEFDPIAAAAAMDAADGIIPAEAMDATLDRAWTQMQAFIAGKSPLPEWMTLADRMRIAQAFIRSGRRGHGLDALDLFVKQQRPSGWMQWSSMLASSDARTAFTGDCSDSAAAAEFMNAFTALFAYERMSDRSLVLFAGVPEAWVRDKGVAVQDMNTSCGKFNAIITRNASTFTVTIEGLISPPPGGLVVKCPGERALRSASVNGQPAQVTSRGEVIVREVPARVIFQTF